MKGWTACIENIDRSRFPLGTFYLYSEPHPTETLARDWAAAFGDSVRLLRIEENEHHPDRMVRPLTRPKFKANVVLYDADAKCVHDIETLHSGIRCRKCRGWYCS